MKKLTTLLMTLMLMSMTLWAEETITVSANSTDISEGLDLKVVAKLFAEAKNLEEFETMLNNPDSAFCNLDLNGDGQVDYLRVVETGEGNKRLIVLQAILAKDIYQDVASIYVQKDEANNVSVQVIGDEYIYGTNYIIEPVFVYRPVIYDWLWCDCWYAWRSPWYWDYWPRWWHCHPVYAYDWYWHHCYAFHHHHHYCSFRTGHAVHRGYHEMRSGVTRRDYAVAHPDRSFERRNSGMTNARDIRATNTVRNVRTVGAGNETRSTAVTDRSINNRTYGSTNVNSRSTGASTATRSTATTTRSTGASTSRSTSASTTRSTATTTRSTSSTVSQPQRTSSQSSASRTSASSGTSRTSSSSSSTRSSGSTYSGSSRSGGSTYGGSSRSGGSTYSGGSRSGGSSSSSGSSSRGGGGGNAPRR